MSKRKRVWDWENENVTVVVVKHCDYSESFVVPVGKIHSHLFKALMMNKKVEGDGPPQLIHVKLSSSNANLPYMFGDEVESTEVDEEMTTAVEEIERWVTGPLLLWPTGVKDVTVNLVGTFFIEATLFH
jgi:hypothetical protein